MTVLDNPDIVEGLKALVVLALLAAGFALAVGTDNARR